MRVFFALLILMGIARIAAADTLVMESYRICPTEKGEMINKNFYYDASLLIIDDFKSADGHVTYATKKIIKNLRISPEILDSHDLSKKWISARLKVLNIKKPAEKTFFNLD